MFKEMMNNRIIFRLGDDMMIFVKEYADTNGISVSDALRQLIQIGIDKTLFDLREV